MFSRLRQAPNTRYLHNWINGNQYASNQLLSQNIIHLSNFSTTFKEYTQPFRILDGSVKRETETFKNNQENMYQLLNRLNETLNTIRIGGEQKAIDKHLGRGKLMARDRIYKILDPGSPFLELSPLAGFGNREIDEETGIE